MRDTRNIFAALESVRSAKGGNLVDKDEEGIAAKKKKTAMRQ